MTPPLDTEAEAHVREIVAQEVSRFALLLETHLAPLPSGSPVTFRELHLALKAYERGEA